MTALCLVLLIRRTKANLYASLHPSVHPLAPLLSSFPITLIPAPGHTPGSWFIIYKNKYLFTGDSLAYSRVLGHLVLDRFHCWQSFALQTQSLKFLRDYQVSK